MSRADDPRPLCPFDMDDDQETCHLRKAAGEKSIFMSFIGTEEVVDVEKYRRRLLERYSMLGDVYVGLFGVPP